MTASFATGAVCRACQSLMDKPRTWEPHAGLLRHAHEARTTDGIGCMLVDYFLCQRCGARLQRDADGSGRRTRWREA